MQVVNPGVGTTTFRYDLFGRRIQKSGTLGTTNYLYDGMDIVEEMDNAEGTLARYAQEPRADQPLSELRSGSASYYDADGLGTITSLTNFSGTTAATYAYDAFGNLLASSGILANPIRYTGREFDSETGLQFSRARYYDLASGRFISEDPIRFAGGANFYDYVRGRPTHFIDPSGLIHQEPDGKLHDDAAGGLEVLCTKGRNRAQDVQWLEQSTAVRALEIEVLGQDADAGHIDRLHAELATLERCKECEDEDKKKSPDIINVAEWEQWFENNKKTIAVGATGAIIIGGAIILAPATGGGSLGALVFVP